MRHIHATASEVVMELFRERLRSRVERTLEANNWSQGDIADRLGVSRRRFNNWLNTSREPSMQSLANICEIIETNPAYLLGLVDEPNWPMKISDLKRIENKLDKLMKSQK